MSQPLEGSQRRREQLSFLLTLAGVIVVAALVGYLLGQYVFSTWAGLPPSQSRTSVPAATPESVQTAIDRQLQQPGATVPAPSSSQPAAQAPGSSSGGAVAGAGTPGATTGGTADAGRTAPASGARPYSVQVGAFRTEAAAQQVAGAAQQQGYPVQVVRDESAAGAVLFKVRVGSFTSREEAQQALQRLRGRWEGAFITQ